MTPEKKQAELLEQAIDKALAHAKERGIAFGTVCATRNSKLVFTYICKKGDIAIVHTMAGEQKLPLNQIFEANLVQEFFEQLDTELVDPAAFEVGMLNLGESMKS